MNMIICFREKKIKTFKPLIRHGTVRVSPRREGRQIPVCEFCSALEIHREFQVLVDVLTLLCRYRPCLHDGGTDLTTK
jgi:hypothetical protein